METILPEPIVTRHLDLLPLRTDRAGEMAAVLSDPGLHAFTGGSPLTAQALRSRYERLLAGSPDPAVSWCNWVIRLLLSRGGSKFDLPSLDKGLTTRLKSDHKFSSPASQKRSYCQCV